MRNKIKENLMLSLCVTACMTLFSVSAGANDGALAQVESSLKSKYPNTTFKSVKSTPVDGIYEVVMGNNLAYVDASGRYFVFGKMFDMQTQTDLSAQAVSNASAIDFKSLPLEDAIKFKKGNGKRVFAMFTDPDCPYCKRIEATLSRMTNYTAYVFLYPIASLHPSAPGRASSIWCSKDPQKAWQDWMLDDVSPKEQKACDTPIKRNIELAGKLGVNGTPSMIHSSGKTSAGAMPREQLEKWLGDSQ